MISSRKRHFLFTGVVLLCACRSDYDFHTDILYEALRGQYQVQVEARGVVRSGHDTSERSNAYVTFSQTKLFKVVSRTF